MDMKRFSDFWRGMFYLVSTLIVAVLLYLTVVVWQPLWTRGFQDFGKISHAIENLDATAKPAVAVVPDMLDQMRQMNQNMRQMNQTLTRMDSDIVQMKDVMNYHMDRMNDKFSPSGMMPFNW